MRPGKPRAGGPGGVVEGWAGVGYDVVLDGLLARLLSPCRMGTGRDRTGVDGQAGGIQGDSPCVFPCQHSL